MLLSEIKERYNTVINYKNDVLKMAEIKKYDKEHKKIIDKVNSGFYEYDYLLTWYKENDITSIF